MKNTTNSNPNPIMNQLVNATGSLKKDYAGEAGEQYRGKQSSTSRLRRERST